MSQFIVSTQEITSKKESLTTLKNTLETQIGQLESLGTSLNSMWEGPAKESYMKMLNVDIAKIKLFLKLVEEFITILTKIISLYQLTEKKNVATATN